MTSTARATSESIASADGPNVSARIVVGVDTSQGSTNALHWAYAEARARKLPIHAVLAWEFHAPWVDPGLGCMFPLGYQPALEAAQDAFAKAAAAVAELLDTAIGRAEASDPDRATDPIAITQEAVEGHPAHVLLASVGQGDILVVGSHGHGGFIGAMLGSISHYVVSHSQCPVVVVPAPQRTTKALRSSGEAQRLRRHITASQGVRASSDSAEL
jgi:nucleotide-binding universal stress UspA family protein